MKVFFLFDRRYGRGLRGKRARKFERRGFERSAVVERTRKASEADVIWVRNIPEKTTHRHLEDLQARVEGLPPTRVLNPPQSFYDHDSKDRAFAAWRAAGLRTPAFATCEQAADLHAFADAHREVLVRINNGACGTHTLLLRGATKEELEAARQDLVSVAARARRRGHRDARPIAVQFLDTREGHDLYRIFRVFVVGDSVYGGYALVSDQPIISIASSSCSSQTEIDRFLASNTLLDSLIEDPAFCQGMLTAARTVGLDVAAIDFLLLEGEPHLLEANPLWSSSFAWSGGRQGERLYRQRRESWQRQARSYCQWMDRVSFYEGMYDLFAQFRQPAAPLLSSPAERDSGLC
jgi:glutathione synthase/RimK-type ligase-like ATP-grasp enzyme